MNTQRKINLSLLVQLCAVFLKLGPSTFGGGYAMIAAIEREVVEKKKWLDRSEMADMISVAGSAPGGVAVNSAAFVGYRMAGVFGAIGAVAAITLPTFIIVFVLSLLGMMFQDVPKVQAALKGVHAAVVALIIVAAFKMGKRSIMDAATLLLTAACVSLLLFTQIHSLYLIIGGPIIGVLVVLVKRALGMAAQTEKEDNGNEQEPHFPEYYI